MASWVVGQRYRGRAIRGEAQIARNTNGTRSCEVMLEVSAGPQTGSRISYRGYMSGPGGARSHKNEEMVAGELRAMGCTLPRWGDWSGIGSKECEFTVLADVGENGRTYYRAAFVRAPATLNKERALAADDIDALPPPPPVAVANGRSSVPSRDPAELAEDSDVSFP